MSRLTALLLLALLGGSATPPAARAWQTVLPETDEGGAEQVVFDGARNVIAAGASRVSGDDQLLTVAKFSRRGELRWVTGVRPQASRLRALAVDAADDVFVAGAVGGEDEDTLGRFVVVKLDGSTGEERWRYESIEGGFARGLGVDPAGNVVAAGHVIRPCDCNGGCAECAIGVTVKLAGDSGTEIWRHEVDRFPLPTPLPAALALRADGDVVEVSDAGLRRLAGSTGAVLWDAPVAWAPGSGDFDIEIDPAGDAVAASGRLLVKISDRVGAPAWQQTVVGLEGFFGRIDDLATDSAGDVLVAAHGAGAGFDTDFVAVKLGGATGEELWRHVVEGPDASGANAIAADRAGDVVVTGTALEGGTFLRSWVVKLAGVTGGPRWERRLEGLGCGATLGGLALDRAGRVAVAAALCIEREPFLSEFHFAVARLSRGTGLGLRPIRLR